MQNILRLKDVLKDKNVTGKELATQLDMTETSISRMLNGLQTPKLETLFKIANVLNVDVRDLIEPTKQTQLTEIFKKDDTGNFVSIGYMNLSE